MHPDTPDDEVLVQVNDIEMAIHKETITDINYTPKTLEEARRHPLWVDGDIGTVKFAYKAFLITSLIVAFLMYYTASSRDALGLSLAIVVLAHIAPLCLAYRLFRNRHHKNPIHKVLPIVVIAMWVINFCTLQLFTEFYEALQIDYESILIVPPQLLTNASVVALLIPFLFSFKAYRVNYLTKV